MVVACLPQGENFFSLALHEKDTLPMTRLYPKPVQNGTGTCGITDPADSQKI